MAASELVVIDPLECTLRKTETVPLPVLPTITSSLPSASRSASLSPCGALPVAKSTRAPNEPLVRLPTELVFWKIDTFGAAESTTTNSRLPSPSKSPIATSHAWPPVEKSTLAASEPLVIVPGVAVLRKTETLPAV